MVDKLIVLDAKTTEICRQTDILATESQKSSDKQLSNLCHLYTPVRNQKAVSFSPSLLLLLAACGGGGGGGSSSSRLVLGPNDALFVETGDSIPPNNLFYRSTKQESDGPVRIVLYTDADESTNLDYYFVTLFSKTGGTVRYIYKNGAEIIYNFRLTGEDAKLFEFVTVTGIGIPQRIEAGDERSESDLISKAPLDYENPRDTGGDNTYNFGILYTTNDQRAIREGIQKPSQTLILEITNRDDGPTTVTPLIGPEFTREGDVIKVSVDEGDTLIYDMDDVTLSRTGLSGVLTGVLKGEDAGDVRVRVTDRASNKYDLQLEFSSAPDAGSPSDSGRDNVYEFEFAGILEDVLPLEFEVTVVDVA